MAYRRRRPRRFRRSKTTAYKALRLARQVSRQVAGEVKKFDTSTQVSTSNFTAFGTLNSLYLVDIVDNTAGLAYAQLIGNQIRLKYLYVNIRFSLPVDYVPSDVSSALQDRQALFRLIVYQDSSQENEVSAAGVINQLFGYISANNPDLSVLPLNPMQPGRFNVLTDRFIRVSDGTHQEFVFRHYYYQNRFISGGRIYYGGTIQNSTEIGNHGGRNHIYALLIYCPPYSTQTGAGNVTQLTNISCMTRLSYYDN